MKQAAKEKIPLITVIILFKRLKDRSHKLVGSSCKDNASWLFSTTGNTEDFIDPETTSISNGWLGYKTICSGQNMPIGR